MHFKIVLVMSLLLAVCIKAENCKNKKLVKNPLTGQYEFKCANEVDQEIEIKQKTTTELPVLTPEEAFATFEKIRIGIMQAAEMVAANEKILDELAKKADETITPTTTQPSNRIAKSIPNVTPEPALLTKELILTRTAKSIPNITPKPARLAKEAALELEEPYQISVMPQGRTTTPKPKKQHSHDMIGK